MTSPYTLLKGWDLHARKALGQNFLKSSRTAAQIVAAAEVGPDDVVMEIGAGLGQLTLAAASAAGRVIAVENAQRQWYWPSGVPQAAIYTTPEVANGWVYVVLMDGQVQVLDAEDGGPQWSFSPPQSE